MTFAAHSHVGVLALQGGVAPHVEAFARLGVRAREVRRPADLEEVRYLALPGGESTTLARLLDLFELTAPLVRRVQEGSLAVFGTCAGAILLGQRTTDVPHALGLLDVETSRNAYGPQPHSGRRRITLDAFGREQDAVFIRAPRFVQVGEDVRVLARDGNDPVLVEASGLLAASFHPELDEDPFLHRYFLERFRELLPTERESGRTSA